MEEVQDVVSRTLKNAARSLVRERKFSITVICVLALCFGINTAMFTIANIVLVHRLPYPRSDRIVSIGRNNGGNDSVPMFAFIDGNNPGFEDLSACESGIGANLQGDDRPELIELTKASKRYFTLFGAKPVLGRAFVESEDAFNGPHVIVLSNGLWRRRFASDMSIVGKVVRVGGVSYEVVGVLSNDFVVYPNADAWIPLHANPASSDQAHVLNVVARLPEQISLEAANSELLALGSRFRAAQPKQFRGNERLVAIPLQEVVIGNAQPVLLMLLAAVGLLLCIGSVNIANLYLARSVTRQRDIAIRMAVGANRRQIVGLLLTQSVVLVILGALLGLLIGPGLVDVLLALAPTDMPRLKELMSANVFSFPVAVVTLLVAAATGLICGLYPALVLSRPVLINVIKGATQQSGTSLLHNRARSLLVVAEIAMCVVLLSATILLIRSFLLLHWSSVGFDSRNVLTMEISLTEERYSRSSDVAQFGQQLAQEADTLPGVESAAIASALPLWGGMDMLVGIIGNQNGNGDVTGDVQWRFVSQEYFKVFRIPLIQGRLFAEHEEGGVVIVSQTMARTYWPHVSPIGQTVIVGHGLGAGFEQHPAQIIGVVGDIKERLDVGAASILYQEPSQIPDAAMQLLNSKEHNAVIIRTRAGVDPLSIRGAVEQILYNRFRIPAARVRTMDDAGLESTADRNFNSVLVMLFTCVAVFLGAVGVYSVMSYTVESRTAEIGIRSALGATPFNNLRLILVYALQLTAVAIPIGVALSFPFIGLIRTQLYGVRSNDMLNIVLVCACICVVALLAAYIPARRASKMNVLVALRHE